MAVPFVLMGVGTGLQMLSQYSANLANAEQAKANSAWYQQEVSFARDSSFRAAQRTEQEYTQKWSSQASAYTAGGIDLSGSAALTLGATLAQSYEEIAAVKKKGEMDVGLARARKNLSDQSASTLSSFGTNAAGAAATFLTDFTKTEGFGSWPRTDQAQLQNKYQV